LVVLAHLMIPEAVVLGFSVPLFVNWFDLGSAAVLIFFVLSGYVIGSITTQEFAPDRARAYLLRRAVRLVPINTEPAVAQMIRRVVATGPAANGPEQLS